MQAAMATYGATPLKWPCPCHWIRSEKAPKSRTLSLRGHHETTGVHDRLAVMNDRIEKWTTRMIPGITKAGNLVLVFESRFLSMG